MKSTMKLNFDNEKNLEVTSEQLIELQDTSLNRCFKQSLEDGEKDSLRYSR